VLPLGSRDYAGMIDLTAVDTGEYVLRVLAEVGDERISERMFRVEISEAESEQEGEPVKRLTVLNNDRAAAE